MRITEVQEALAARLAQFPARSGELSRVARDVGLSLDYLSQVRRGKRQLALEHVDAVAGALGLEVCVTLRPARAGPLTR